MRPHPTDLDGPVPEHDKAVVHPAGGQQQQRLRPRRAEAEAQLRGRARVQQGQLHVARAVERS